MEQKEKEVELNVRLTYPNSSDYEFLSKLEIIDMDKEAQDDINSGNGFRVSAPYNTIKKDMKNIDGIYSSRFGQKFGDVNPFANRYSCECGNLISRINNGIECPLCHTKVKYVDDNFKMFGWIILNDEYHIIHPKFFDELNLLMGESPFNIERKKTKPGKDKKKIDKNYKLKNIINYSPEVDQHGIARECEFKPDNEPFYGIGMIEFYNRFDEIIEYYYKLFPKKKQYYDDIVENRDKVFIHSIPVFTTHLRPTDIRGSDLVFDVINGYYNMINKHAHNINKTQRKMDKNLTVKNSELYKLQMKYMELCEEVLNTLSTKYGVLRNLISGRYNFSSRAVIRQDPSLRIDQVKLPYTMLVKTLQQRIINILMRSYNMNPSQAYDIWSKALVNYDDNVGQILHNIIRESGEGIPVIINRNPTIAYGSILQMFCIDFTNTLTMSVPLQVLSPLGADFDGDVLNIFVIINDIFFKRAYEVFNPRNSMYISHINGKLNTSVLIQRDTLINANTLLYLGRDKYSDKQRKKIDSLIEKQKVRFET